MIVSKLDWLPDISYDVVMNCGIYSFEIVSGEMKLVALKTSGSSQRLAGKACRV